MVSDILPLEKETSPEKTQEKMKQIAKVATTVIQATKRHSTQEISQLEVDYNALS